MINNLPDEELTKKLEQERGKGRNDYPVRAVWNSILAGIVYQHASIESMRRELRRNAQLREICGFDLLFGERAVPPAYVYTRFCRKLMAHIDEIDSNFARFVKEIRMLLPDLGRFLAIDSKAVHSLAKRQKRDKDGEIQKPDGRCDTDADFGRKDYRRSKEDGTLWQKTVSWFGYKLHLIVVAAYELPVSFSATKASVNDMTEGHKLIDKLAKQLCCQRLYRAACLLLDCPLQG